MNPIAFYFCQRWRVLANPAPTIGRILWSVVLLAILHNIAVAESADAFVELPRNLEIELALSALPADLQKDATIYVRDPKNGFVMHRKGTNDWVTFVARTSVRFYGADWAYRYPNDQLIPQAHDKIGEAHHMIPYFDIERMRINGVPADEAKKILQQRFADGTYSAPTRGGFSYMLAPIHRAYMEPAKSDLIMTVSFPHHMPYSPHMNTETLGQMDPHSRSGVLDHASRIQALMVISISWFNRIRPRLFE